MMFSVQKKETINKTLRFPLALLTRLEAIANSQSISVSNLIFQACEYALDSLTKGGKVR